MQTSVMPVPASTPSVPFFPAKRISSIDFLRGLVIVIMALDHVRDYFHADSMILDPTDLQTTTPAFFFTRWITHFCAPVFVFLAGTSAFLVGQRKSRRQLSKFLVTRGLWLIFLEITIVNFGWFFNIHFTSIFLAVIWVLGLGMIILSAMIHLPYRLLLVIGLLIVAGHNLLDTVHVPGNEVGAMLWAEIHERRLFQINRLAIGTAYPILPWLGIMLTGYCFGSLYRTQVNPVYRKKMLQYIGIGVCCLFILLRAINVYGDPSPWQQKSSGVLAILSFLNVTKYPPSLLYASMTLGPAILLLSVTEDLKGKFSNALTAIGRVPMFFYILHIYFIHLGAMLAISLMGHPWTDMILSSWPWTQPQLKGYGFSLGSTYLIWLGLILLLYPLCAWYDKYKSSHKDKWWLSYL
jgi:uncharacterized membrane protein